MTLCAVLVFIVLSLSLSFGQKIKDSNGVCTSTTTTWTFGTLYDPSLTLSRLPLNQMLIRLNANEKQTPIDEDDDLSQCIAGSSSIWQRTLALLIGLTGEQSRLTLGLVSSPGGRPNVSSCVGVLLYLCDAPINLRALLTLLLLLLINSPCTSAKPSRWLLASNNHLGVKPQSIYIQILYCRSSTARRPNQPPSSHSRYRSSSAGS